jgi:flagellar M-ring protein FliF
MLKILASLSVRQKATIAVVALAVIAAVYALVNWQKESSFKPLFTNLSAEDAAAMVTKLKESSVEYRLPESGGSVLVPANRLAELRLTMASAGLPKTGRIGFELFDKTNLGTTEFAEQVNYRRALEGELERSVMSLAEVESARVHLTFPKESVFLEAQKPGKASVLVKIRLGSKLSPANVQAITHLVASAVESLGPESVSVLDMNGNLLNRPRSTTDLDGTQLSEAALDYRHSIETDLISKINSTLEPLLGAGRYHAGVSVDCDFSGADQSEEIYDPARTVMTSSQRSEDSSGPASSGSGASGSGGAPGTASTLPRPTSTKGSSSGSRVSRLSESISYQSSRTVRKTHTPSGSVRKMSISVILDQALTWEKDKSGFRKVIVPPPPEKIKIIRDLVAGAIGLDATRGDQLVIETLPFENTLALEPPQAEGGPGAGSPGAASPLARLGFAIDLTKIKWDKKMIMIAAGSAVGVLLLVGLAVFLLRRKKKSSKPAVQATAPTALSAGESSAQAPSQIRGETIEAQIEAKLAENEATQRRFEAQALNALKLAPVITKATEVLAKHLREKIATEPEIPSQVLRTWIRDDEG